MKKKQRKYENNYLRLIHISEKGEICTDINKIKYADYYLLDSFNLKTNQVGGTGLTHDWNKSRELIKQLDKQNNLILNATEVHRGRVHNG